MDLDPLEIGHDQERWVLEGVLVVDQLAVGGPQVLALALVLPGEVATHPDIGEAVMAIELLGALLEGVPGAGRVGVGGRRLAEHPAQVAEVGLGRRPLAGRDAAPFGGELGGGHPCGWLRGPMARG